MPVSIIQNVTKPTLIASNTTNCIDTEKKIQAWLARPALLARQRGWRKPIAWLINELSLVGNGCLGSLDRK